MIVLSYPSSKRKREVGGFENDENRWFIIIYLLIYDLKYNFTFQLIEFTNTIKHYITESFMKAKGKKQDIFLVEGRRIHDNFNFSDPYGFILMDVPFRPWNLPG